MKIKLTRRSSKKEMKYEENRVKRLIPIIVR